MSISPYNTVAEVFFQAVCQRGDGIEIKKEASLLENRGFCLTIKMHQTSTRVP